MTQTLPNFMPALDPATASALRDSIEKHGVVVPVVVDQHGRIIDGHHRSRIADDLGLSYMKRTHQVADEDEFRRLSVELNTIRRHMPIEERRKIVAELRASGHSLRAIGRTVGADEKQVRRDLSRADMSAPAEVMGEDGKRYPATKPATTPDPPVHPGQTSVDDHIDHAPAPEPEPAKRKPTSPVLDPNATPEEIAAENERTHRYSATRNVASAISLLRLHPATTKHAAETVALLDARFLISGDDISPGAARHVATVLNLIADAIEGAAA